MSSRIQPVCSRISRAGVRRGPSLCGGLVAAMLALLLGSPQAGARSAFIDWASLHNPFLQYADWSIKDACMAEHQGQFYVFFSAFYRDAGRVRSHLVEVKTTDFQNFSEPLLHLRDLDADADGQLDAWIGLCSPNLTHHRGTYYLTFNSWGDKEGQPNQLFFMSSKDLEIWSDPKPLARNLTQGWRSIDGAVAFDQDNIFLLWKGAPDGQTPRMAIGETMDGDFRFLGDGYPMFLTRNSESSDEHENYQFIRIQGKWRVLVTAMDWDHMPYLYTMAGSGENALNWLNWVHGYKLEVPRQSFNTHTRANAAFLADWTARDGYVYLLYAGNDAAGDEFAGRGWNRLGLCRSKDLEHWMPLTDVKQLAPRVELIEPLSGFAYFPNRRIHVLAKAFDPTNAVARVDFYVDDRLLATDRQPPYQATIEPLQAGVHQIRAEAIDVTRIAGSSETSTISVGWHEDDTVLLVMDQRARGQGDAWLAERLEGLGFRVQPWDQEAEPPDELPLMRLVYISDSVSPRHVEGRYAAAAIPVITSETGLYQAMWLARGGGAEPGMSVLSITKPDHPIAGGLSGRVSVARRPIDIRWGQQPAPDAKRIAHLPDRPYRVPVFSYEAGDEMIGGHIAPSRRVALFFGVDQEETRHLTEQGWHLFEAAVQWATRGQPATRPAVPSRLNLRRLPSGAVRLSWVDRSDNEKGFIVERATDAEWTEMGRAMPGRSTVILTDPPEGPVRYRVRAFNDKGRSGPSNSVAHHP